MFRVTVTPNAPYNWPMNVDPLFEQKTTDMFVDPDTPSSIPSLWSNEYVDFNINIQSAATLPDTATIKGINAVTVNDSDLVIEKIGPTTYRVTGVPTPFKNEYYEFVFDDNTLRKLPPVNKENWKAVVKWNPADPPWERVNIFTINVNFDGTIEGVPVLDEDIEVIATQYVYWSWEKGLQTLEKLIAESKV